MLRLVTCHPYPSPTFVTNIDVNTCPNTLLVIYFYVWPVRPGLPGLTLSLTNLRKFYDDFFQCSKERHIFEMPIPEGLRIDPVSSHYIQSTCKSLLWSFFFCFLMFLMFHPKIKLQWVTSKLDFALTTKMYILIARLTETIKTVRRD